MEHKSSSTDEQVMELLHQYGTIQRLKALEILIHPGETCDKIYYVLKGGFLRRFYNDKSEIFRTISFHLPIHRPFVTVNENFFAQKPSSYEIKAFQASEILVLKRPVIDDMTKKYPLLQEFSNRRIMETLIYENEIKARLISYSSKELYNYLCEEHPAIIQNVPSKYIAEFMSISPEWLSKLRQQ